MLNTCVQSCVQAVYFELKTVPNLCNIFVQTIPRASTMRITTWLYTNLFNTCALLYPLKDNACNSGVIGVIPTVHTLNNKNDIRYLRKTNRKTVEEAKL